MTDKIRELVLPSYREFYDTILPACERLVEAFRGYKPPKHQFVSVGIQQQMLGHGDYKCTRCGQYELSEAHE